MIFGWIFAGHQLGSATAAYGAGMTRTLLLTYSPCAVCRGIRLFGCGSLYFLDSPTRYVAANRPARGRLSLIHPCIR